MIKQFTALYNEVNCSIIYQVIGARRVFYLHTIVVLFSVALYQPIPYQKRFWQWHLHQWNKPKKIIQSNSNRSTDFQLIRSVSELRSSITEYPSTTSGCFLDIKGAMISNFSDFKYMQWKMKNQPVRLIWRSLFHICPFVSCDFLSKHSSFLLELIINVFLFYL